MKPGAYLKVHDPADPTRFAWLHETDYVPGGRYVLWEPEAAAAGDSAGGAAAEGATSGAPPAETPEPPADAPPAPAEQPPLPTGNDLSAYDTAAPPQAAPKRTRSRR